MINKILTGIIKFLISIVNVLIAPIDNLISQFLPSLSGAINAVGAFLNICTSSLGWVLSLFGLSSDCLSLLVIYFTFKLTAPIAFSTIKLAIKWYDKIKL